MSDLPASGWTMCSADKTHRTITIHVRKDFGDGTEDGERETAVRIFNDALDFISGKSPSPLLMERWPVARFLRQEERDLAHD